MNKDILLKFAHVLLKAGVQLKDGQNLFITAPLNSCEFVRVVTEAAYRDFGAKYVKVFYKDGDMNFIRARYSKDEYLSFVPQWEVDYQGALSENDCCALDLVSGSIPSDEGVAASSLGKVLESEDREKSSYWDNLDGRRVAWTIAAYPSKEWAKIVYPEMDEEDAMSAMWQDFIKIYRLDKDDPAAEWENYRDFLKETRAKLNKLSIKKLHLKSETMDIHMDLCSGSWKGGSAETYDGRKDFMGNIPTHEVFHVPLKTKVDGYVKSTMPLNYNGKIIKDIELWFKDGKVYDFKASKNQDMLKIMLETDEGSSRLGEIGMVSVTSPIYQTGRVFYTTLFDENAVTHLALGAGCESVVSPGKALTDEEAEKLGVNRSSIHVDFMVGSESLTITAELDDKSQIEIMKNGRFNI